MAQKAVRERRDVSALGWARHIVSVDVAREE